MTPTEQRNALSLRGAQLAWDATPNLADAADALAEALNELSNPTDLLTLRTHFLEMVEARLLGDAWAVLTYIR